METIPTAMSMTEVPSSSTSRLETMQAWVRNEGEQLEMLRSTLREIVWMGSNADTLLHSLDNVRHEAASGDDTDSDYESILQSFSELSQNMHNISPESLEIMSHTVDKL